MNESWGEWDNVRKSLATVETLSDNVSKLEAENYQLREALFKKLNEHREALEGKDGKESPLTKPSATVLEVALFLSSSNSCLRSQVIGLMERRKRISIQVPNYSAAELNLLENMTSRWSIKHPINQGTEIPFSMCPAGPAALAGNWQKYFPPSNAGGSSDKIVKALNENLAMFAKAKALNGTTGFSDLVDSDDTDFHFGFEEYKQTSKYLFDIPTSEDSIILVEGDKYSSIKCATVEKLIEEITSDQQADRRLRKIFLLTYHNFTTTEEVLNYLVNRFFIPSPPNVTPAEYKFFLSRKRSIRLKIFNLLQQWLKDLFNDFEQEPKLRSHIRKLLTEVLVDEQYCVTVGKSLIKILDSKERLMKKTIAQYRIPKAFWEEDDIKEFGDAILQKDEKFIAEQIVWKDFEIFRRIHPKEFANNNWTRENKEQLSPTIFEMTGRYAAITCWVQDLVLGGSTATQRAAILRKLLKVAEHLWNMNDFHSLAAVYFGLKSDALNRLDKTIEALDKKSKILFAKLSELLSVGGKMKNLRGAMQGALLPCIPFIAMFLGDLTFIEMIPDRFNEMVNFSKLAKLAERVLWVQLRQQSNYKIKPDAIFQVYAQQNMKRIDDKVLYDRSLEVEPR